MPNKKLEMLGYEFKKSIIPKKYINNINNDIKTIMESYLGKRIKIDNSTLFEKATTKSKILRNNLYKIFGKLVSCIEILSNTNIKSYLKKKNFKNIVLVSYSIVIMEPNFKKFLFPIHQDLKRRISNKSLLLWIPLNNSYGGQLGGMTLFEKSHKLGPLYHEPSSNGVMQLKKSSLKKIKKFKKISIIKYNEGDVLFMSPFIAHNSIMNKHLKKSRWTLIIQVDDAASTRHLSRSLHPYNIDKFTSNLSNEEIRKTIS